MAIGRGNCAGPITGGYLMFNAGPLSVAASTTSKVVCAFPVPCAFRLERIGWNWRSASGATADTIDLFKNTTPVVSGGTRLHSGASPMDLDYITSSWVAPAGETIQTSGLTLSTVAGVRDVAQNQYLLASITTDATAGGLLDFNIYFLGVMMSQAITASIND
jgi:hypothetical protein